jgi:hypothetical protein
VGVIERLLAIIRPTRPKLEIGTGMDTEYRVIAELLALKDAPDDVLLDRWTRSAKGRRVTC